MRFICILLVGGFLMVSSMYCEEEIVMEIEEDITITEKDNTITATIEEKITIVEIEKEKQRDKVNGPRNDSKKKSLSDPLLPDEPLNFFAKPWTRAKEYLRKHYDLDVTIAYMTVYQGATPGHGAPYEDNIRQAFGGKFESFGFWHAWKCKGWDSYLNYKIEAENKFARIPAVDLWEPIGSLWQTTIRTGTLVFSLSKLWWTQYFLCGKGLIRIGKIDPTDFFDLFSFDDADNTFLNGSFTENLGVAFPDRGLGFQIQISPTKNSYILCGLSDMNGHSSTTGFRTFFEKREYIYLLEGGWLPDIPHMGKGNYHVTLWYSDPIKDQDVPSNYGVAFVVQQAFGKCFIPFLRYTWSHREAANVTQSLVLGFGCENPFGRTDDFFGIGAGWGTPGTSHLRDQYIAEIVYRLQLTEYFYISPDFQIIINPSYAPEDKVLGVFGLRARILM